MVKKLLSVVAAGAISATVCGGAIAGSYGTVSTDRFGYSGVVTRYASLSDAQNQVNSTDTVPIGDRDLSIYVVKDDAATWSDFNYFGGSWWYTIDPSGNAGNGNTSGNGGVGFSQLYDSDGSTETTLDMTFSGFDGTYFTQFDLLLQGSNAGAADSSRFSVYDNVNDGGIWHEYELALTATGLEGVIVSPGFAESTNQPTAVTGNLSGLFELTENQTSPANQGFYVVDLDLSTTNWAWENRDDLTGDYSFADSLFRAEAVPSPSAMGLGLIGGLGLIARRRRGAKASA